MTESATHPSAITADPAAHPAFGLTDVLLFAMAAIWGANFVVVKYATHIFKPIAFTGLRVGVAATFLLTAAFVGGGITIARLVARFSRRDLLDAVHNRSSAVCKAN